MADRFEERREPVDIPNMQGLRLAGPRTLIVAPWDPKQPNVTPGRSVEVMIPLREIDPTSIVKGPGDKGTLTIPLWLAVDRGLEEQADD